MTHTEESLMALADDYWRRPQIAYPALRLAISEVLAERDALGPFMRSQVERAEKAEAELDRVKARVKQLLKTDTTRLELNFAAQRKSLESVTVDTRQWKRKFAC